ncbi:MAG: AsmA family protein, partial [Myxococcota bacterium]
MDGNFSFDVGLEPTFVATGIRIENPPWADDPELGRVDRLEVQISLVPLLSGVILVPRLFLEGVELELDVNAEGESNWELTKEKEIIESQDRPDPIVPLFDSVTVRNLVVTFTDRRSGQSTAIYLDSYSKRKRTTDAGFDIVGNGRVNDDDFQIRGRIGSLETALTAKEPYAFSISFDMLGLAIGLEGTASNAPRGEGLAVRLNASAPSVARVLDILKIESPIDARLDLSALLSGDLDSLSMSDLVLDIGGRAGQRFHAEGSVADVLMGRGLDVTFTGTLLREPTLARHLPEFVRDIEKFELQGRMVGSLEAPAVEDLRIRLAAPEGSELVLDGRLGFDVSGERAKLATLGLTASLSLPSVKPIERLLGAELPDVGPLDAKAIFTLAGDRIAVESLEVEAERFEGLRLAGRGKLARISQDTLDARIEAELDLSASIKDLRTLEALTTSDLPPIGPISIATRLSLDEDGYLLDDLRIRAGSKGAVWAEAKAKLGPLRFDDEDLLRFLSGDVVVEWASAAALGRLLNEDIPDVGPGTGGFRISGRPQGVRISNLRIETGVPGGVTGVVTGEIQAFALSPKLAVRGMSLDVEADSKTTEPVSRVIGLELPELGPVRLRARFT